MDKTTKWLLAVIAFGLLLNGLNPWLQPLRVSASPQADELTTIRSSLSRIERGSCANSKIC
jgi:hypothetical protein